MRGLWSLAAAQASAWVAEDSSTAARARCSGSLRSTLGAVYLRHDASVRILTAASITRHLEIPAAAVPLNQNINYLYGGGSLYSTINLTTSYSSPWRHGRSCRPGDGYPDAAKNDSLLATGQCLFQCPPVRGQYAGAVDVVDRGHKLVERITLLSEDLVPGLRSIVEKSARQPGTGKRPRRARSGALPAPISLRFSGSIRVLSSSRPSAISSDHIDRPRRSLDELIAIGRRQPPRTGLERGTH